MRWIWRSHLILLGLCFCFCKMRGLDWHKVILRHGPWTLRLHPQSDFCLYLEEICSEHSMISIGLIKEKKLISGSSTTGKKEVWILLHYTTLSIRFHACVCELSCFSCFQLFATWWTVASQAPLSMGFSRQEYWSGLPFPSPGDLPHSGNEPASPALQAGSLPTGPPGTPTGFHTEF